MITDEIILQICSIAQKVPPRSASRLRNVMGRIGPKMGASLIERIGQYLIFTEEWNTTRHDCRYPDPKEETESRISGRIWKTAPRSQTFLAMSPPTLRVCYRNVRMGLAHSKEEAGGLDVHLGH